jgi:hypothetical protein
MGCAANTTLEKLLIDRLQSVRANNTEWYRTVKVPSSVDI